MDGIQTGFICLCTNWGTHRSIEAIARCMYADGVPSERSHVGQNGGEYCVIRKGKIVVRVSARLIIMFVNGPYETNLDDT